MLTLKMKRMCSRIIASLSAVGLVSIADTDRAEAANYSPEATYAKSDTFTHSVSRNIDFSAEYSEVKGSCSWRGSNILTGVYTSDIQSNGGVTGICTFQCVDGAVLVTGAMPVTGSDGGTGFSVPGMGGAVIDAGDSYCQYLQSDVSCKSVTNATSTVKGDGTAGYYCEWTCKDGYSVGGGTGTTTTITSERGLGQLSTNKTCDARNYKVNYDCSNKGTLVGEPSGIAVYGKSFTIESSCDPKPGWSFDGWKGN